MRKVWANAENSIEQIHTVGQIESKGTFVSFICSIYNCIFGVYIHSFKVGRVGDEELFDVIQFTHSFQLEAQAKKECRSV